MKITCEACGSRYAIPDDMRQQANQSLKIRCKNCGAMITVAGSGAPDDAEVDVRWFYAVESERMGPVSLDQLRELVEEGTVDGDSLVWCRGMGEWQPACEVEALEFMVDAVDMVPGDTGGIFDALALEDAGQSSHARNDTSVLFSLDDLNDQDGPGDFSGADFLADTSGLIDLQRVAARQEANSSTPQNPFSNLSSQDAPFASSGTGVGMSVPVLKRRKARGAGVWIAVGLIVAGLGFGAWVFKDALLSNSPADGAAGEPAAVTVAATTPEPVPAVPGGVEAVAIAASSDVTEAQEDVPALASDVATSAPLNGDVVGPAAAAAPEANQDASAATADASATPSEAMVAKAGAPKATAPTAKTKASDQPKKKKPSSKKKKAKAKAQAGKSSGKSASKPATASKPSKPEKAPSRPATSKKEGGVNDLLKSLSARKKASPAAGNDDAGLPQRLSASMVRSTLRKHRGRLSGCRELMNDPEAGAMTVKTSVVINGSGSVASARVVSAGGAPGSVQSCIVRALKKVRFPRFRDPKMTINYPIQLR